MTRRIINFTYRVRWSEEDGEFVATCDQYKLVSFLHKEAHLALYGLIGIMSQIEKDLEKDRKITARQFKEFFDVCNEKD